MNFKISVEGFEIEVDSTPSPIAHAFGAAIAPWLTDWISRRAAELFPPKQQAQRENGFADPRCNRSIGHHTQEWCTLPAGHDGPHMNERVSEHAPQAAQA